MTCFLNKEKLVKIFILASLLFMVVMCISDGAAANKTPVGVATQLFPDHQWQTPALRGDFKCDGKVGYALLGWAKNEIIIVVFLDGLDLPPEKISMARDPKVDNRMSLSVYGLDISDNNFKEMLGAVPEGFRRSKRCKGLSLSDGETDPYNFYWNKDAKAFWMWRM